MNKDYYRNLDMEELMKAKEGKWPSSGPPRIAFRGARAKPLMSGAFPKIKEKKELPKPPQTNKRQTKKLNKSKQARTNSIFAQSVLEKVVNSWELVATNKHAVGLDFFSRVLSDNPDLIKLFSFGSKLSGLSSDQLKTSKFLRGHASAVMEFMGRGIEGLSDIDSLIPDLRALGQTHVKAGVLTAHYDMFYKHLMAAFATELKDKWDQDTANAWAHVFNGMKTVMDQPEMLNQTEPLTGWGLGVAISSAFIAVMAPIRLAGFLQPLPSLVSLGMDCMELIAAVFLAGDLLSPWIIRQLSEKKSSKRKNIKGLGNIRSKVDKLIFPFKFLIFRALYRLQLEQWLPWPRADAVILLSYLMQNLARWYHGSTSLYATELGVSWLHAIGLLRIIAVVRVSYFARCAENAAILKQATTEHWRRVITISNLVFTLLYVTHVSACIWCIVARIELGTEATEAVGSEFFPDAGLLLGKTSGALSAYLRAIYWAWVNLAGTGNVESAPVEPLEICATLFVHLCGATLYAIVTGHVVSILDQFTQKENQVGNDLAELRAFMDECEMPQKEQEKIMQGYITQTLMRVEGDSSVPCLRDDVGRRLPSHFRQDLELHAHTVGLQRRNQMLKDCSSEFLFALASGMTGAMTLLPGDYLFETGEVVSRRFCMVIKGCLEIISGDESIGSLDRGCVVGLGWLVEGTLPPESWESFMKPCELSDWLLKDGTAGVSIRATSDCLIRFGLASPLEIEALQRRFPADFETLEDQRLAAIGRAKKLTLDVVHAVVALKRKAKQRLEKDQ